MSTLHVPENVSNSDLVFIIKKQKIKWPKHISSLNKFTSDSSWSVYNARKDDADIVPCVNSVLPLLRQSVATYIMQKHCIVAPKNAIDALNPGQVTVDTSDQLVHALLENIYSCLVDSTLKNFF